MLDAVVAAAFQHMQRADDVGVHVRVRVLHPVTDARLSGEVDNPLRLRRGEQPLHARAIGKVELVEGKAGRALELAEARLLQFNVVVGIEIIDADYHIAPVEQRLSSMVTDESGGAGDQNPHVSYSQRLGPNCPRLDDAGNTACRR